MPVHLGCECDTLRFIYDAGSECVYDPLHLSTGESQNVQENLLQILPLPVLR